jgi:hypothetical protein
LDLICSLIQSETVRARNYFNRSVDVNNARTPFGDKNRFVDLLRFEEE